MIEGLMPTEFDIAVSRAAFNKTNLLCRIYGKLSSGLGGGFEDGLRFRRRGRLGDGFRGGFRLTDRLTDG